MKLSEGSVTPTLAMQWTLNRWTQKPICRLHASSNGINRFLTAFCRPHRKGKHSMIIRRPLVRAAYRTGVLAVAIFLIAMIIWQGITAHGAPDPTQLHTSPTVAFLDIGVLVFREGLECVLVLAAITASMTGSNQVHRRPVAIGAGIAFVATLITWFIAVQIVGHLTESVPALELQAATGLLAVIVLLVIMNWFLHRIYWGGWIRAHNRRKKALFANSNGQGADPFFGA
jgi:high-affinity iron transporter